MIKYLLPKVENEESVRIFTEKFLNGELEPFLMSESIPEVLKNENGVSKIVKDNFKDIVFDVTKDVLVVFHVEWCGFCKTLMPEIEEIGRELKDHKDIVIGKILMSANDLPINLNISPIKAYPTIRIYKKGTNDSVEFVAKDKPANKESVLEFIKKECDLNELNKENMNDEGV